MTAPTLISPPLIGGIPQQLVTLRVAALMLGLSERTLFRRIHDGSLPARKLGQRWMIHVDDLNTFGVPNGEWVSA